MLLRHLLIQNPYHILPRRFIHMSCAAKKQVDQQTVANDIGLRQTPLLLGVQHGIKHFLLLLIDVLNPADSGPNGPAQFLHVNRLLNIADCAKANGRSQIFLVRITADKNNLTIRQPLPVRTAQLSAVHTRHADIGEDDVRTVRLKHPHRLFSILSCLHLVHAKFIPLHMAKHSIPDGCLVFHDDCPNCFHICPANIPFHSHSCSQQKQFPFAHFSREQHAFQRHQRHA